MVRILDAMAPVGAEGAEEAQQPYCWDRQGQVLEYSATSWLTNLKQFCKYDQFVGSIMWALRRLWPSKPAVTWHDEFTAAVPSSGVCERQAAVIAGVRHVLLAGKDDHSGRFMHASIVRYYLNCWLPAGSRGVPYLPSKLCAAPAFRFCRRAFAELVSVYCTMHNVTLPAATLELVECWMSTAAKTGVQDIFGALLNLSLKALRGVHVTSILSTGVQVFFYGLKPFKPGVAGADGAEKAKKAKHDEDIDEDNMESPAESAAAATAAKKAAFVRGSPGLYSLKHVPVAAAAPTLQFANVELANGGEGQLLVGVTTVEDGKIVYHGAGDPGWGNTYAITPPAGSKDFKVLLRASFGDASQLPQRCGLAAPYVSRHPVRRNCVPPAIKAAEAAQGTHQLDRAVTAEVFLARFAAAAPSRAVVYSFWGSVAQRSRRLVSAACRRACLHAFVKSIVGTADCESVVFYPGTGFGRRNAGRGQLAANVASTLEYTSRHLRCAGTNEWGTSKNCPVCHCGLMLYDRQRMGTCSNAGCGVKLDRDVVGASNILRVVAQHLTDGSRPADLCPPPKAGAPRDDDDDDELAGSVDDSDSDSDEGAHRPPAHSVSLFAL